MFQKKMLLRLTSLEVLFLKVLDHLRATTSNTEPSWALHFMDSQVAGSYTVMDLSHPLMSLALRAWEVEPISFPTFPPAALRSFGQELLDRFTGLLKVKDTGSLI